MKKLVILFVTIFVLQLNAQVKDTKITLDLSNVNTVIDKNIYGNFSEHLGHCIYGGIWVGENSPIPNTRGIRNDVVSALKKIKLPILRWPGGCFADEYHWMDGIGPKDKRPKMVNTNWGGVVEDNSFGTHEFMDFCELVGAEPYICGNVGSGTVEEMSKWVEYLTFSGESPMANLRKQNGREKPWKVKYWAVGNENWGCGGNMTAQFYSDQLRRYSTYCRNYGDNKLYKVGCTGLPDDFNWVETMMQNTNLELMQGLSLHNYTFTNSWDDKGEATKFTEADYFSLLKNCLNMEYLIEKYSDLMDKYDPKKKMGLVVDEWGNWFKVEPGTNPGFLYQQNTLRDAITAASTLNIFNNHAERIKIANIAQMINVLQSIILTDGPKMVLTPTYFVYDLYKVHQDAKLIPTKIETVDYSFGDKKIPAVNCSASQDVDGKIHLSLVNVSLNESQKVVCVISLKVKAVAGDILTSEKINMYNTFEQPNNILSQKFGGFRVTDNGIEVNLPPKSVVVLEVSL
jgi:alpha-L-arabinofuranosidase